MTPENFKTWAARLAQEFPSRRARLEHIATGPDDRSDVQAARRLLVKYQTRAEPQSGPMAGKSIGAVLGMIALLPLPQRDAQAVREFVLTLPRDQNTPATPEQVKRAKYFLNSLF